MSRRRGRLPVLMAVLVVAALAFAIVAGRESGSNGRESGSSSAGGAPAGGGTVSPASGSRFDGAALPPGIVAPAFTLARVGSAGSVSLGSLRGRPVVLAFLYSHCGGTCVLIAQQIRGALDELARGSARAVIISTDPSGDTPASVRTFLARTGLSGRVEWLSGSPHQLQAVWRSYRVKPASAGASAFSRYATVLLIDATGSERVLYGQEQLTPEALAHDIGRLQAP